MHSFSSYRALLMSSSVNVKLFEQISILMFRSDSFFLFQGEKEKFIRIWIENFHATSKVE